MRNPFALVHHGVPALGVIHLPLLGRRYWAAGHGRVPRRPAHQRHQHQYADRRDDRRRRPRDRPRAQPRAQRVRMLGSAAVDLALVADGTITLGINDWDMAAGVVLAARPAPSSWTPTAARTPEPHLPPSRRRPARTPPS
ncbi:inositol monophosphatase family protein [Streptomyces sp. NPDC055005]